MKFSGKAWSYHRDDLISFWVNSGKWVGGSKVNLLSPDIDYSFHNKDWRLDWIGLAIWFDLWQS